MGDTYVTSSLRLAAQTQSLRTSGWCSMSVPISLCDIHSNDLTNNDIIKSTSSLVYMDSFLLAVYSIPSPICRCPIRKNFYQTPLIQDVTHGHSDIMSRLLCSIESIFFESILCGVLTNCSDNHLRYCLCLCFECTLPNFIIDESYQFQCQYHLDVRISQRIES